ncbi:hypothetical protein ACRAJ3_18340 [Rhodococcus pyridinivorans]|uniref:hypothetical protein n=1 Tax=Rhodococcus TaxID=1827 RepID=UPI001C7D0D86|nr:hypothetical protein [Rhodococcus sp. DMU2021]MBX4171804.1 hypothetical protein [Rhodococcus sp. DMU2021]
MDSQYVDRVLQRLAHEADYRPAGWTPKEIADFHLLVQCARAAKLDTDLRNMRLLRLRPCPGGGPETALAPLGESRQITLTFKSSDNHITVAFELLTPETETPR